MRSVKGIQVVVLGVLAVCTFCSAAPATHTISGVVATGDGLGVEGVDLVGDNGAGTAVTDVNGTYSVIVPNNWSGTITVSKADWLITPASKTYNKVRADISNENYTAYQPKISGHVKRADGTALVSATVTANNSGGSDTTDSNGFYELFVPYEWSGTVSANLTGYHFTDKNYANVITDQVNQDFTGFQPKISGYVRKADGTALSGAAVTGNNSGGSDTTDSNGFYELFVPYEWSGTVSANLTGYHFTDKNYANVITDQNNQDFSGFQPKISGHVKRADGTALVSATVTANNSGGSDTTDPNGYYELFVPYEWSGTITVSFTDYGFTAREYTNVTTDQVNQNFTGFQPKISGYIEDGTGTGIEGVLVIDVNGGGSDYTDANGFYEIIVPYNWSGRILPIKLGLAFNPNLINYNNVTEDLEAQDFIAYPDAYGGGTGEPNDPYQIWTAEQMSLIGLHPEDWNKHFRLMADIDLSAYTGTNFNIIGRNISDAFTGVFDGNNHTISNFTYSSTGTNYIGIFGFVEGPYVEIKNVYLADVNVDCPNSNYVGALVGYVDRVINSPVPIISGCIVSGGVVRGKNKLGGLVGSGVVKISNCHITCRVTGEDFVGGLFGNGSGELPTIAISQSSANCHVEGKSMVGGLVGRLEGQLTKSFSNGTVNGTGDNAGGLVGELGAFAKVTNCYSTCNITGSGNVGGLVGLNGQQELSFCYSAGSVTGSSNVGGLVGCTGGGYSTIYAVHLCYWDTESSGQTHSSEGKGKTTEQMMDIDTFAGWGHDSAWTIDDGNSYPRLAWEAAPGELIIDPNRAYGGGSGTAEDPYLIYTPEQLHTIGFYPDDFTMHFKLMDDIDLSCFTGNQFNVIGNNKFEFEGVFDGNGHEISNFTYIIGMEQNVGLFGRLYGDDAQIIDLTIRNANIVSDNWNIGGLTGSCDKGTIARCVITNSTISGRSCVGGVTGFNGFVSPGCTIQDSSFSGSITSTDRYVGGIAGINRSSGIINYCHCDANISGVEYVGGVVGMNYSSVVDCYSMGTVAGDDAVGGLVGWNEEDGDISITYSAALVNCIGICDEGGLVGVNEGAVDNSFWDVNVSGQQWSAGGEGKTTAQMQTPVTFANWSCEYAWTIDNNDYPRLAWENQPGERLDKAIFGGGSGEPNNPYLIAEAEQLQALALADCLWSSHFELVADINMSGYDESNFSKIGNYYTRFSGVFDGNNHTISNFTYTGDSYGRGTGLFAVLHGNIRNLVMMKPTVNGVDCKYVGALAGWVTLGTIENCSAEDVFVSGGEYVGGLIGYSKGRIENCSTTGVVNGEKRVGGLSGYGSEIVSCHSHCDIEGAVTHTGGLTGGCGNVLQSYSTGTVEGRDTVGGLAGFGGEMTSCYSISDVEGEDYVGGFAGTIYTAATDCYARGDVVSVGDNYRIGGFAGHVYSTGTIERCYSTGLVTSSGDEVGGLVGNSFGPVIHSFWDANSSGQASSDGGTGKTTAEMQTRETFTDAGWDFVGEVNNGPNDVWRMCVDGVEYPKLWWEFNTADFVCPDGVDFIDFAVLADTWLLEVGTQRYNPVCDISIPADEIIDILDLEVFTENWLMGD